MQNLGVLARAVGGRLADAGQTVAIAESSTGGLVSAALLAVPGASAYFVGGTVIYTARSRKALLGVRPEDVAGIEPLTEPMAAVFAHAVRGRLDATWGVAELGIAGPAGARYGHPPGISVIAVVGPVQLTVTVRTGSADREVNMERFAEAAVRLLDDALDRSKAGPDT